MNYEENARIALTRLRKERGLSQTQICEITGLKQGNISKYEKGERMLSLDNLGKLVDFYGVSADDILGTNIKGDIWKRKTITHTDENTINQHIKP